MSNTESGKKSSLLSDVVYLAVIALNVWLLVAHPSSQTSDTVIRVGVIAFCGMGFLINQVSRRVPTPEKAAAEIMRQQKALYGGPHEFVRVGPEAFEGLDLQFYDNAGAFLYTQGFGYVADIQDKTAMQEFRWGQSVIRTLLGDGGTVCAGIFHLRVRGWVRVLQVLGLMARRMKTLDLETELSDDTFVVTCNTEGVDTTGEFRGIDRRRMPPDTPHSELLLAHRARVRAALAARPGAHAIVMRDLTDLIAMQHRIQAAKNAHKQDMGYLDTQELATIMGGRLDETGRAVALEIEQIRRTEALGGPPTPPPLLSRR